MQEGLFEFKVTVTDVNKGSASDVVRVAVISQNVPYVRITEPSDGAVFPGLGTIRIIAIVTPTTFIDKVTFYIDDVDEFTDRHSPFMYDLDLTGRSGVVTIRCVAFRIGEGNIRGGDEIRINVERVVPIPLE